MSSSFEHVSSRKLKGTGYQTDADHRIAGCVFSSSNGLLVHSEKSCTSRRFEERRMVGVIMMEVEDEPMRNQDTCCSVSYTTLIHLSTNRFMFFSLTIKIKANRIYSAFCCIIIEWIRYTNSLVLCGLRLRIPRLT